jgi:hypothetical protein
MTLPRSAGDVLSDHVTFELESIDRLYCNLYVPQLQRAEGIVGFIRGHLGRPIASTAVIAPMSRDFTARLRSFADAHDIPWIDFARGQRKDDVMHEHLAAFEAAGRTEGVLFIGLGAGRRPRRRPVRLVPPARPVRLRRPQRRRAGHAALPAAKPARPAGPPRPRPHAEDQPDLALEGRLPGLLTGRPWGGAGRGGEINLLR